MENQILNMLDPRSDDWNYRISEPIGKLLNTTTNKRYDILKQVEEYGVLLSAMFKLTSSSVRITIFVRSNDGTEWRINATPAELYTDGFLYTPAGIGLNLIRYDTTNNIYVVALQPPWPFLPYRYLDIYVDNESSSDVTLTYAKIARIRLEGSSG